MPAILVVSVTPWHLNAV